MDSNTHTPEDLSDSLFVGELQNELAVIAFERCIVINTEKLHRNLTRHTSSADGCPTEQWTFCCLLSRRARSHILR